MKKVFAKCVSAIGSNKLLTIGILSVAFFGVGVGVYAKSTDTPKTTLTKPYNLTTNQVKNETTEQAQSPTNSPTSSPSSPNSTKPNSQNTASGGSTTSTGSSNTTSSGGSGASSPDPEPQPITEWNAVVSSPDRCSPSSAGDVSRCYPNQAAHYYINLTGGVTIKSYSISTPFASTSSGANQLSPTQLYVWFNSSVRDSINILGAPVTITVNENAIPQSKTVGANFRYDCIVGGGNNSGCAPL